MSKIETETKAATVAELSDEIRRMVGVNNATAERYEQLQKSHKDWVARLDKYRASHAAEMDACLSENLSLREENIQLKKRLRAVRKAIDASFETELPRAPEVQDDDKPTRYQLWVQV